MPLAYGHCYAYAAGTGALVNIHGSSAVAGATKNSWKNKGVQNKTNQTCFSDSFFQNHIILVVDDIFKV